MEKYEYKVVALGRGAAFSFTSEQREKALADVETQLNELGFEGWELVQQMEGIFYFKREIRSLSACRADSCTDNK